MKGKYIFSKKFVNTNKCDSALNSNIDQLFNSSSNLYEGYKRHFIQFKILEQLKKTILNMLWKKHKV